MNMNNISNPDIDILVCCHKQDFFINEPPFLPIHVGKALSDAELGIQCDNTGDNISHLNSCYCELTAHYWYWKNKATAKYVGLNHYRRYFGFGTHTSPGVPYRNVTPAVMNTAKSFKLPDLDRLFARYDIVLARPNVYPYSLATDYSVAHSQSDLIELDRIITDICPEYKKSFDAVIYSNNKLSHYNMFITRGEIFNRYSEWLFRVLSEAQKRIPVPADPVQGRIYGYMSERLLNVYVHHYRLKVKYVPVLKVCDDTNITTFPQKLRALMRMQRNNLAAWLTKPRLQP